MNVAKRITQLRSAKGYSVNKLATLSGISQSYLRDVELENKNPTVEIVSILCDTLGITLADFFDDQTEGRLSSDPLFAKIYQLSPKQRTKLLDFLDSL
ncbi:MAG: helix-turn-helix transcriptional regulator [Lachnospiraceae bacterium]|jgi:transcriptional regulator with XRE-family HTH domain|nr:helix-turn-helix transcriptional regulator [Lachnospiraceae bacterium]